MAGFHALSGFTCGLALGLALVAKPVVAQTVSLPPSEVRALASSTLQAGNPADAARVADLLLARFPEDPTTLLIRTEAAILLRDFAGASAFGQRAFRNAASDGQRFNAARLTALGHARRDQYSRAQLWLRVARQYAPSNAAAEAVAEDFRAVRRNNPLTVNLRFGITPSNNINGGTFEEEIIFDTPFGSLPFRLSPDAQAISGWQFSGGVDARYLVRSDRTSATFLDFGLSGVTYRLTRGAREELEAFAEEQGSSPVTGQSFSSVNLRFGATHRFALFPDIGITETALSFSRSFRKDEDETNTVRATLSHNFELTESSGLGFFGAAQRRFDIADDDEAQSYQAQLTYSQRFEDIGVLRLSYGQEISTATDSRDEFDAETYTVSFSPDFEIQGTTFSFLAQKRFTEWDFFSNFEGAREDEQTIFRVTAVVGGAEFFGFNPVISVTRDVRDSTGTRFNSRSTTVGFDLTSSF